MYVSYRFDMLTFFCDIPSMYFNVFLIIVIAYYAKLRLTTNTSTFKLQKK